MPQVAINSNDIINFGFSIAVNIYDRTLLFNTATLTSFQGSSGSGRYNVLGIAFSLVDEGGVELMSVDWSNPPIEPADNEVSYTLDLSSSPYTFLFQTYKIIGYIKDADGTVYNTTVIYKKVCTPNGINENGYVDGTFQVIPDCVNNNLTVKELTVLTYNNQTPESISKTGSLYYPTGTISPVTFTGTPFTNNVVYTGQYRIVDTTISTYNIGDDFYVLVTYLANQPFDVTCASRMGDLMCCIVEVQDRYLQYCNDAIGQNARQQLQDISIPLFIGISKEVNGQDASSEADLIRKTLKCNCGTTSVRQNELTPVNPSIYSIVLNGVGGTTIPSPSVVGSTKTYNIASNVYQVVKGNISDGAYSISTDTATANTVKYVITFDYNVMAGYLLNAIGNNPTLVSILNSLITSSGNVSLTGLNGKCIIDLTTVNLVLTQPVNSGTLVVSLSDSSSVDYIAPPNLFANNASAVQTWLNTLGLGSFTAVYSSGILTIISLGNTSATSSLTFTNPDLTVFFQRTNKTLVDVLQALVDYLCALTALQVKLGTALNVGYFDYNGNIVYFNYIATNSQDSFNIGVATAINNIIAQINSLTGVTCAKLKAIFVARPGVAFGASDIFAGTLDGDCAGLTDEQAALAIIAAVSKYSSVKTAWCAIDCGSPATCPDISAINANVVGVNIGIYGVSWSQTPLAVQTVTVKYRLSGTLTYTTATSALLILPNGNLSGSSPYIISGVVAGATYDIFLSNNCGGSGFVQQITMPTGTVYSGSFLRENMLYLICGATPITLYSSQPFGTGTVMYTNIGLTIPMTGYSYIAPASGNIFTIDSGTGEVGEDTGSACSSGTAGLYVLGNDSGTVCSGTSVTRYTNGAFSVGGVLYTDAGLTTPQTGYSYVVDAGTGIIYNLNSSTGAIGVSTGITCDFAAGALIVQSGVSTGAITSTTHNGSPLPGTYPRTSNTNQKIFTVLSGTHTLVVNATGIFGSIAVTDSLGNTQCQNYVGAGAYTFLSFNITAGASLSFEIKMQSGTC